MVTTIQAESKPVECDVVIIGAGFSGIAAADAIHRHNGADGNKQISFIVLDADEREGGRTSTEYPELGHLDMGGQYLTEPVQGPEQTQRYLHELVKRFNVELLAVPVKQGPERVYEDASQRFTYTEDLPVTHFPEIESFVATVIEPLVSELVPFKGHPWDHPKAAEFDSQSVEQWLEQNGPTEAAKDLLRIGVQAAYSVETMDISLLYFLHYGATCGSFVNYEVFGETMRFKYGTLDLYRKIVASLPEAAVHRPVRVTQVQSGSDRATVTAQSRDGLKTWLARRVIVAMSPMASQAIAWSPPESDARKVVCQGAPTAHTVKVFVTFKSAFWRPRYSGYAISSRGPVVWVKETTDDDAEAPIPTLMLFIVAGRADQWAGLTLSKKRDAVCEQLARLFDTALDVVTGQLDRYVEKDWARDPYARGCPAGCFLPGVLTRDIQGKTAGSALASPAGVLYYAGSETGKDWQGGYINGAVEAGQRAAAEVLQSL